MGVKKYVHGQLQTALFICSPCHKVQLSEAPSNIVHQDKMIGSSDGKQRTCCTENLYVKLR